MSTRPYCLPYCFVFVSARESETRCNASNLLHDVDGKNNKTCFRLRLRIHAHVHHPANTIKGILVTKVFLIFRSWVQEAIHEGILYEAVNLFQGRYRY